MKPKDGDWNGVPYIDETQTKSFLSVKTAPAYYFFQKETPKECKISKINKNKYLSEYLWGSTANCHIGN